MSEKTIGHELVVKNVRGFEDARRQIYDLIGAGIVKCGQCECAATNVFWQDEAEWYCRCNAHLETGQQWTGSTRWRPSAFSLNVLKDKAEDWLSHLAFDERKRFKIQRYDATDYYALMPDDMPYTRHYLVGDEDTLGAVVYVDVHPLTNGAFAYQLTKGRRGSYGSGSFYSQAIKGMWPTEAEAVEAARKDAETPNG